MKRLHALLISLSLALPGYLSAQIFYCDGKWTNQACNDSSEIVDLPSISRSGSGKVIEAEVEEVSEIQAPSQPTQTRIRLLSTPIWTYEGDGKNIRLKYGQVLISNTGKIAAQGISVRIDLPRGTQRVLSMKGPTALDPGATGTYELLDSSATVPKGTTPRVTLSCANCRR